MEHVRTNVRMGGVPFVLINFPVDDVELSVIDKVAGAEGLRPVTRDEFFTYRDHLPSRKPDAKTMAFGNKLGGDFDSGGFHSMPYLDTDGKVKTHENWVRRLGTWKYVFAPIH